MRVIKRRLLKKNGQYTISLMAILLLSFLLLIGQCSGNIVVGNDSGFDTKSDEGKMEFSSNDSDKSSSEEQINQLNEGEDQNTNPSTTKDSSSEDTTIPCDDIEDTTNQNSVDDDISNTTINSESNTTDDNTSFNGLLLNNFINKDIYNISKNTVEYLFNKFNFTTIDEELEVRFLELVKKPLISTALEGKILNLSSDRTLNKSGFSDRLLSFIKTIILNERDVCSNEIASKVEKVYNNIKSGEKTQFQIQNRVNDTGIDQVLFIAKRNLSDVKVSIIKLKQKPDDIPLQLRSNKTIYQYLDIKLTSDEEYILEKDIEQLTFTFKVEQSWIVEQNIDKTSITLIRYHDGEWQDLTTIVVHENETYILLDAETPGCSTFAVVGSTLVEIPEPYVTDTPKIPWMVIVGVIASITIILITVLFKARYIYFEESPSKEKYIFYEGDPHKLKNHNTTTAKKK
jgi:PGF-pre-PGF domain-containing protein